MFALGFVLFGTTQLLPQLVQSLLGYTATIAGLVLTPGGFVIMVLMPVVGFLVGKVQPRTLIALGLLIEAFALYHMSQLSLQMVYSDVVWARIIQASGLAFVFVPITTVAYVGLPPGKNNNASALINLMRNMGGSFGISLAQTWLARRTQFHQARLVGHFTPYNSQYQGALQSPWSSCCARCSRVRRGWHIEQAAGETAPTEADDDAAARVDSPPDGRVEWVHGRAQLSRARGAGPRRMERGAAKWG
jgi:hypothetical protein